MLRNCGQDVKGQLVSMGIIDGDELNAGIHQRSERDYGTAGRA